VSTLLIPILPFKPAEVKVRSENGPPNSHVGGVDFYWSGIQTHPFLLTQTVTLPFALFLRPAIVSVHVKIRRQELQSVRRTRYLLAAANRCKGKSAVSWTGRLGLKSILFMRHLEQHFYKMGYISDRLSIIDAAKLQASVPEPQQLVSLHFCHLVQLLIIHNCANHIQGQKDQ